MGKLKPIYLLLLLLMFSALLTPAGLADESYAPVPYTLYPAPEGAYVGDTMPFVTEDGTLELYYLYETDHNGLGTGSVMQDQDGLYHLFYTGHNDIGNSGKGKECVMHAVSTDREEWTKIPEDTFYSPEGYSKDDFRDPEVSGSKGSSATGS